MRHCSPMMLDQVGYKPALADDLAWSRRWRGSKLERQPALRDHVLQHLAMGWSPEQVACLLTRDKVSPRVSDEYIYGFIDAQIARTKDYSWCLYLRQGKSQRGWGRRKMAQTQRTKDRFSYVKERMFPVELRNF